ncbi:MAG: hypothetical protein CMP61_05290 [Flavobacteriales bacterium]|nr:hypothetical protein [Flavobacteriales bacterium]|tara:strand:+ start:11859 stop:12281 length:423 start_codon:yes stop_codon:yes gene_type:complete
MGAFLFLHIMNIKLTILNGYFFLSLMAGFIIKIKFTSLLPVSSTYLYAFFVTIPLFILQFVSISSFSRKVKRGHPKLFKQACKRANGSSGSSINVATLFDENKIFDQLKNPSLIREFHFVKRVVIFSMVSFLTLIVLYFV